MRFLLLLCAALVGCSTPKDVDPSSQQDPVDSGSQAATPSDAGGPSCPVCDVCPIADAAVDATVTSAIPSPAILSEWEGGSPHARALYISDGDSIAFGYYVRTGQGFTALAAAFAGEGVDFVQLAYPGAGIVGDAGESVQFSTRVAPLIRHDIPTIVSQNAGINDAPATAQQIWDAQSSYCAQVRAAGAKCVIISLLPHVGNSFGKNETIRQLQRDHWAEVADGFADMGLEPEIADASDLRWYVDGVHPTPAGHVVMLRRLLPALLGVLADAGVGQ
jgi:lysophospholipase L1-like esterase